MLKAVRISVGNGSVARHFWETALGLQFVDEYEVSDEQTRATWGIRHGALRLTRLEVGPGIFPYIELLEWEGCSDKPIRDPRHPWDYGILAVRIPASDLGTRLARAAQWRCKIERKGDEACICTPSGERVVLRSGGEPAVIAVVPTIAGAKDFFHESRLLPNGVPPRVETGFAGSASVDLVETLRLGSLELTEFQRSADPRPAGVTESRMNVGFTGYCMLSVTGSTPGLFCGPGGIPVEVAERFLGVR